MSEPSEKPVVAYDLRRARFNAHQCMTCGAPETHRSESPDERLEHSYCEAHAPRWLRRAYGEPCKHEMCCKHCGATA